MAQSVSLIGIAHVALRVSNLEQSRAFYEKLGFEQAFAFSEAGKVTQSFIKINDRQFIELYPRSQENQAVGLTHVCYESADITPLRELLVKQGAEPTEVKKARAGNFLFVLHDPESELIEYTEYLPGSLHSEDRGKHLGANRVSKHFGRVVIPVRDAGTEQDFYVEKLGFSKAGASRMVRWLTVPGSQDSIGLAQTGKTTTRLHFSITNLKKAKRGLREAGVAASKHHDFLVVVDPDGNEIVFEQTSSRTK